MEAKTTTNEKGLPVHTFPLFKPRTMGGIRYPALSMAEPHVKANMDLVDVLDVEAASPRVREINMLAILCGVPVELIEILHPVDYGKLQALLQNFPSPEDENSGGTSSDLPA